VQSGLRALEDGSRHGPSAREAQLERELTEVTGALGEAHVELRLLKRDRAAGFASRSWR
jgi:transposase